MNVTAKQDAVLKYIEGYIFQHGVAPTFKDIMSGLGLKSKSSVTRYLDVLVERGKIKRMHRRERAIELIHDHVIELYSAAVALLDHIVSEGDETTVVRSEDIGRLDLAVAEWEENRT